MVRPTVQACELSWAGPSRSREHRTSNAKAWCSDHSCSSGGSDTSPLRSAASAYLGLRARAVGYKGTTPPPSSTRSVRPGSRPHIVATVRLHHRTQTYNHLCQRGGALSHSGITTGWVASSARAWPVDPYAIGGSECLSVISQSAAVPGSTDCVAAAAESALSGCAKRR